MESNYNIEQLYEELKKENEELKIQLIDRSMALHDFDIEKCKCNEWFMSTDDNYCSTCVKSYCDNCFNICNNCINTLCSYCHNINNMCDICQINNE